MLVTLITFFQLSCIILYWVLFPNTESICMFSLCLVVILIIKRIAHEVTVWFSPHIGIPEICLTGMVAFFWTPQHLAGYYLYLIQISGLIYRAYEGILVTNISFKYSRVARDKMDNMYSFWGFCLIGYAVACLVITLYFYYEIYLTARASFAATILLVPCIIVFLFQFFVTFWTLEYAQIDCIVSNIGSFILYSTYALKSFAESFDDHCNAKWKVNFSN
jgi:hypothetical protein